MSQLLTYKDLSLLLKLSRSQIERRIAQGAIPRPFHIGHKCPRWRRDVIEAWMQQCEQEAAA